MIIQFQAVSRLSNATHIHNIIYIKWMWSNICREVRGPDGMKSMHMISRDGDHSEGWGVGGSTAVWNLSENSSVLVT